MNDRPDALRRLLTHPSIDINSCDSRSGCRPIHFACSAWSLRQSHLSLLLSHPSVDVNLADDVGRTPLHIAAAHQHQPLLYAIMRRGEAEPLVAPHEERWLALNCPCPLNTSPYDNAHLRNYFGSLKQKDSTFPADWQPNRASLAAHYDPGIIRALLCHPGIDVNETFRGRTALHLACLLFAQQESPLQPPWNYTDDRNAEEIVLAIARHPNVDLNIQDPVGGHCLLTVCDVNDCKAEAAARVARAMLEREPGLINLQHRTTKATVLHQMPRKKGVKLLGLVMEIGVEVDWRLCDANGKTAIDYAYDFRYGGATERSLLGLKP